MQLGINYMANYIHYNTGYVISSETKWSDIKSCDMYLAIFRDNKVHMYDFIY